MCKHILINDFKPTDLDTLTQFADMTSDNQGYGAILRYANGDISTMKSMTWTGFYIGLTRELVTKPPQTVVVHHRTSTNGKGLDYAHPFEYQGNYLTHNGVVDVPGKHDTKTTNDSEALLHHLVKSNWDTASVRGYYSCFVVTQDQTTVLVDNMAPIYTDGRVYSSHKLDDSYYAIECQRLTLDRQGSLIGQVDIEVNSEGYGHNLAYLSLGASHSAWNESDPSESWTDKDLSDTALEFLDSVTPGGYDYLMNSVNENELELKIEDMATNLGLKLSLTDCYELVEYISELIEDERESNGSSWSQAM